MKKKNLILILSIIIITIGLEVISTLLNGDIYVHILSAVPLLLICLYILVDERDKIQKKVIEDHEINFKNFFQSIRDMLFIMDYNGKILYANRIAYDVLGYTEEDLKVLSIFDVHMIDDLKQAQAMFGEIMLGQRNHCPIPLKTKSGTPVEVDTRIWQGKWFGNPCIYCLSKDNSEQQLALNKFTKIFENNASLMALTDYDSRIILDVNNAFTDTLGYQRQDVVGKAITEFNIFYDKSKQLHLREVIGYAGRLTGLEIDLITKSGEIINGLCSAELIDNAGQRILLTVVTDYTEQKKAEIALKKSYEQFTLAVDGSNDGIWDWDLRDNTLFLSKRWKEMLGYKEDEIINDLSSFSDNLHPEDKDRVFAYMDEYFEGKISNYEIEFRMKHKDGHYVWILSKGAALRDEAGIPYRMAGSHSDFTERKNLQEELVTKTRILQAIVDSTHELMNSLNYEKSIMNSLQVLAKTINADRGYYFINHTDENGKVIFASQKAEWCSDRINSLINNPEYQNTPYEQIEEIISVLEKKKIFKGNVKSIKAPHTRLLFEGHNIKSLIILPIIVKNKFFGFIGFDDCTKARKWTDTEQELLNLYVLTISKAIEKQLSEDDLYKQESSNHAILEAIPDMIFVFAEDGTIIDFKAGIKEELYLEPIYFIGKNVKDIMPPEIAIKAINSIKALNHNKELQKFDYKLPINDIVNNYEARIVKSEDNTYIALVRNMTESYIMRKALNDEKNLLRTTLLSIGDGVITTDINGVVTMINKVAEELTGWNASNAIGKPLEEVFNIINEKTRQKINNPVRKVLESGKIVELANHTCLISLDNIERPIEDSAAPIRANDGTIIGVVLVFRDFSDKKKKQEIVEFLSYHDYVTGLYNRAFYERELKKLDKASKLPLSIIMADVNGLKLTNDAFGHKKGDDLLKMFATILTEVCDIKDSVIARIGGDEFAIILPKTSKDVTTELIKKLNKTIAKNKLDKKIILSVAFGCDTRRDMTVKLSELIKGAEDKMYSNKLSEGNSMRNKTISIILKTLYEKNRIEEEHSKRVGKLSGEIARVMGMSDNDVQELEVAGLMHDIGKIGVEVRILNKNGKLDENEQKEIRKHSEIGYRILNSVSEFSHIANYVLYHHERWDGKGYPKGLKANQIPLKARIIAVADAYDAMTSERAYRKPMTSEYAVGEIKKYAGIQFDPNIARFFIEKVIGAEW